jgi:hypothetical protein
VAAVGCIVLPVAEWGPAGRCRAANPVAVRVENFTVPPATGPVALVRINNLQNTPYFGCVTLVAPAGWQVAPAEREVQLAAGEVKRVPFAIEKARTNADNMYECEARATGGGTTIAHRRSVQVASAPYFKPKIDGDPGDWDDAIPMTLMTSGKQTVVRTYWNRRAFSILVAVEEDRLVSQSAGKDTEVDAVQFALAAGGVQTPTSAEDEAVRYEWLLCGGPEKPACYRLLEPGTPLKATQQPRPLAGLRYEDASVAISRSEQTTYYECSLPMRPMSERIRPSEGREFSFGLLVHDPDGTGVRDFGLAADLWPWQRNPLAWSRWPGAQWPEPPPFDSKLPWGMCSSKY